MEHAKAVKEWSWQILHISSNQHNLKPKSFRERRKIKQNSLKWVEGENMIKIRAEIKEKKWLKKKKKAKISITKRGLLERRNEQIMVQTYQQKKDNKSIKFDMIKDDIISDITEIRKNHKGLKQTTISQ